MAAAPSAASCSGPSRRPKPTRHLCHMANDILIVDDEADIRMLIAGILEDEGYDARSAANAREALDAIRSEEHTSELQSLMRISYAVFCLKKKKRKNIHNMSLMNQYKYIRAAAHASTKARSHHTPQHP